MARWTYVWLTDDGPSLGATYPSAEAALDAAYAEWEAYDGGNLGGYEDGTREEFDAMYAESGDIWTTILQDDEPAGAATDAVALDAITDAMSGQSWDADTLELIAERVRSTGRVIADIEGGA